MATEGMIAVIGGSGLYTLGQALGEEQVRTPWGKDPVTVSSCHLAGQEVLFLPRHGPDHKVPPHRVAYREQVWALRELGARAVVAINAVGGIHPDCAAGTLVVPDQIIDYSWGRPHTYFDGLDSLTGHCDFTDPYDPVLRRLLLEGCRQLGYTCRDGGTYACTQGPRLETRAEIRKLAADGADIVGMTGMPEASLAREAGLSYASLALVVNAAAGLGGDNITLEEIRRHLDSGIVQVREVLPLVVSAWQTDMAGS